MNYEKLIDSLIEKNILKNPEIINAFRRIKRKDFMLEKYKAEVGIDEPFPIGAGQTISQPQTVAFMLETLQPQKEDNILDIGSGSAWTSCLLAEIVGSKGKVTGCEIIPKIYKFGKENSKKYKFKNLQLKNIDASGGYKNNAPYDRILSGASSSSIPEILKKQLKKSGVLVAPVQSSVIRIEKKSKDNFQVKEYPYFAFVPMTGEYGQK